MAVISRARWIGAHLSTARASSERSHDRPFRHPAGRLEILHAGARLQPALGWHAQAYCRLRLAWVPWSGLWTVP